MRKISIAALLLGGMISAQQTPKQDSAKAKDIQEVNITKKIFERKTDRMVYDVAASPSAKGSTALDLLKETPTVIATEDDKFSMPGKSAVAIYINGRKTNMNADALNAMLKNTPAENISKIEVISMPGSEFDVPGNTGIINIVMKKRTTDGYNGTLRMENEKAYRSNPSTALNLNLRQNKFGANISTGYSETTYFQEMILENGIRENYTVSSGSINLLSKNLYANLSLDYDINEKNYLNFGFNSNFSRIKNYSAEFSNQSFYSGSITNENYNRTDNPKNQSDNLSGQIRYELTHGKNDSKLKFFASYLNYKKDEHSENRTFALPTMRMLGGFNQISPQQIDAFIFQGDEVLKFKDESTLSFGGNVNLTKTDNDTRYETADGFYFITNPELSNHFVYKENIASAYTNYERNFSEKISAKAGLRFEHTTMDGEISDKPEYNFRRSLNDILPFVNLSWQPTEKHSLNYGFTSRVQRPSFWELNPVRNYTTPNNYVQNNPFMIPAKIYEQELMYMLNGAWYLQLSHYYTRHASAQIPLQKTDASGDVSLRYIRTNYGDNQGITATVGMQKAFLKGRWIANASANFSHQKYSGSVDTDPLTLEVFEPYMVDRTTDFLTITAGSRYAFDKAKTWWLNAQYFLQTKKELEMGHLPLLHTLNLSLQKNWENWTFKGSVSDVFNGLRKMDIINENGNGYFNNVRQRNYSQRFALGITYNFGNQKLKRTRQDGGEASELKSRTGGK
ncbi:TonB-dependent receptor [Cruoricaptor ignavus]|uniref:TonB-dependent receptor n=1 Tax=Cruoricaptor ignavus TaxID=1118202 RepID=A0A7M1T1X1_9FLAO|nr:outer membrane beta-barrel family protein [Cruoricaptor ignavus]QOR72932.1 TonB-dependent receptor [Cruoricaptor ignavus]